MDMVCEKTPSSRHDFTRDPIVSRVDGDWLVTDGTTLGADNGIAMAYALALAENEMTRHPPLELLFTVDEERGLNGVKAMQQGLLTGKSLINLDSEDEGVFTIGCAGGVETVLTLDLQTERLPDDWISVRVTVGGLRGGHSGIDIHKERANANKLLARVVATVQQQSAIRLQHWQGGSRHNAIARDASVILALPPADLPTIEQTIEHFFQTFRREYGPIEPNLSLDLTGYAEKSLTAATDVDSKRVAQLILALPHGVARRSPDRGQTVQVSSNLATVRLEGHRLTVVSSQRSSVMSRLEEMTAVVHAVGGLAGATAVNNNAYPPWEPDADADLLKKATAVYRRLFAKDAVVQVIHAGLECAIIGRQYPGMQLISFGPNIENAHSPNERLHIPSIGQVWDLLAALLSELKG
jgi:dipeptidase D